MALADPAAKRVCIVLQSSYLSQSDQRVTEGTVITPDSASGMRVQTLTVPFYPARLVAAGAGRAALTAGVSFGRDVDIGILHMLDTRSGTLRQRSAAGHNLVDVAADPQTGHLFAVDGDEHTVIVVDTATGAVLGRVRVGGHPQDVAVAERAGHVFVDVQGTGTQPTRMVILDARTGAPERIVAPDPAGVLTAPGSAFAVDAGLGHLFGTDGTIISMRDTTSGRLLATVGLPGGPIGVLAVSEATHRVFVLDGDDRSVSVLDAHRDVVLRTVRVGRHPVGLAVDDVARRVFVVNQDDGTVSILSAISGRMLGTLHVGVAPVAIAVASRRGRTFVYNATSATISVLDTRIRL